jgi:hypothetical protein
VATALPASWLKTQTERQLDGIFSYVHGTSKNLSLEVSFKDVKANIVSDRMIQVMRQQIFQRLPPCRPQDLAAFSLARPICNPPDDVFAQAIPMIKSTLTREVTGAIPNTVHLLTSSEGVAIKSSFAQVRSVLQMAGTGLFAALAVLFVLLLLIALCAIRSLKDLLRWWGIPLFVASLLTLIGSIALPLAMQKTLTMFATEKIASGFHPDIMNMLLDIVQAIARSVSGSILWCAIPMMVVGMAMIVGSKSR